ncbi:hypothetical protein GHV37_21035 [Citrobacter koseri]|uniref:hypothetical protein n=1 Tax=Citrobacter koseri TaxID=545 RepID=UPI001908A4A1|nr:hypothetical protein [Citrobacter koseri]MBJ9237124.1 hypothetical protein [Citrobacter koseri]
MEEIKYYFSAATLGFYTNVLKDKYDAAGSWPVDAVEITEEEWEEFTVPPDDGRVLGVDENGHPAWAL